MKKKMLNIVLLVIMILMVGCGKGSMAEPVEPTKPAYSLNEQSCNTKDNNIEESNVLPNVILYPKDETPEETIYNLKSVSVFIVSRNEKSKDILQLSMTYIGLRLITTANVGTDLIRRESLRPRRIAQFGKIITINYDEYNPVVIGSIGLDVKIVFTGFYEYLEFTKEGFVNLIFNETEEKPNLVGELLLNEEDELKLIFKAEIERVAN